MPSRLPNNKFQSRSRGIRFNLEKIYLNQMQEYLNKEIRPILVNWIKKDDFSKVKYNQLERKFDKQILEMANKHFTDILKLSLTEKYGCYDDQTEVLTKNGWKLFDQIKEDDELITMKGETEEIEYQFPSKIVHYKADKLIQIKNSTLDIVVTPNHKIWGFNRNRNNFKGYRADSLPTKLIIPRSGNWIGKSLNFIEIPSYIKNHHLNKQKLIHKIICRRQIIETNTFLKFLGWYIAEGSIVKNTKGVYSVITIAQTKEKIRKKMKPLLEDMCFKQTSFGVHVKSDRYNIHSVQLIQFMKEFHGKKCYEKRIPRWVLELDKTHLIHLFEGLMDGDGTRYWKGEKYPTMRYATTSKGLADDVQELALKCGFFGSIRKRETSLGGLINGRRIINRRPIYIVNIRANNTDSWIKKPNISEIEYSGNVYCVSVPNQIIYVRRNGNPYWCGNSWHRVPAHEVQKMLSLLLKRSHFLAKGNYFSNKIFSEMLPFMKPSKKIQKLDDFPENMIENIVDRMNKGIGGFARTVYTHSTYFINSAYEIQFKMRDPKNKYRYIWGTRPDLRRTPQCTLIEELVNAEIKRIDEKGVTLEWLKKTVDEVANMPAFIKANPDIPWCPHFGCRSGIERIVV